MGADLSTASYPGTHDPSFYTDVKVPYPAANAISLMDALDQSTVRIKIVPDNLYLKSDNGFFSTTPDANAAGSFLVNVYNSSEIGFTYVPTGKTVYIHTQDDESLTQGIYDGQEVEKRFFLSANANSPVRLNLFGTPWPLANNRNSPPMYLTPIGTTRSFGMTTSYRGWNIPDSARKQIMFEVVDPKSPIISAYKQFGADKARYSSDCCTGKILPNTDFGAGIYRACFGSGLGAPGACDVYTRPPVSPPNTNPNDNPDINNVNPNIGAAIPSAAPPAANTPTVVTDKTTAVVVTAASTTPSWVYIMILVILLAVIVAIVYAIKAKKNENATAAPGAVAPSLVSAA